MFPDFSKITIFCFFASYLLVLLLEVSRLWFRMPVRLLVMVLLAGAGFFAHTVYLWLQARQGLENGMPLSSWYDWYLIAAWLVALTYLVLAVTRPQTSSGIFILPIALSLIGVAYGFPNHAQLPKSMAVQVWGILHGILLLLGTATVSLGFVAGLLYLMQSSRLKNKRPIQTGFRLPSLEWLQRVNKLSLVYSLVFVALGMISGVILNLIKFSDRVPWTDSVVISSGILLAWLLIAAIFELTYKPAQQGRKVAYLTVASFIFLAMVVLMLTMGKSQHARTRAAASAQGRLVR